MAGTQRGQALDFGLDGFHGHADLPVLVSEVAVNDAEADGTAHREPVTHAADDLGAVRLDLLPLAATVTALAASKLRRNVVL